MNARSYCSWFGFKGGDQQKKGEYIVLFIIQSDLPLSHLILHTCVVATLSGGERNRCQLAKVVKSGTKKILSLRSHVINCVHL